MKIIPLPSKELLDELLNYVSNTGKLYWKHRSREHFKTDSTFKMWNTRYAGKEAFTAVNRHGYKTGLLFGKQFLAHRVIYKIIYGIDPEFIDHENGIRTNNKIEEIKSVSSSDNNSNRRKSNKNTSGVIGVSWHEKANKWQASIKKNGVSFWLGLFSDFDEAVKVRRQKEIDLGFHPNHGR